MIVGWLEAFWHFAFGWPSVAIVVGTLAIAFAILEPAPIAALVPRLRSLAIFVAIVAFSLTAIAGKYYHDGRAEEQRQLDAGLAREAANGEAAHSDAVRSVRSASPGSLSNDRWNRDRQRRRPVVRK